MEQRLKNIGELADAITTLSQAVMNLSRRMKEAEAFQVMVLEKRIEELEQTIANLVTICEDQQKRLDWLVDRVDRDILGNQ